ncbi:MAG: amidohydrolase family protein [Planctomycetota bacterium]|jgi:imidazolonepropionase-like amidohydrolase|nr:amidohydrolase family protein [Planctomycetota bacterium]MDP6989379.1 amidohydrolase family protein [Planctomycetota bacterium]
MITIGILAAVGLLASPARQSPPPPGPCVLSDVRLTDEEDAPRVAIVVRSGRVAAVLEAGAPLPSGLRRIDGEGALALPAFIDAYTTGECDQPEIVAERDAPPSTVSGVAVGMRAANRKGLAPSFLAVEAVALDGDERERLRSSGFGALHIAPSGELLAGRGAAVTTSELALRERILAVDLGHNASFQASGGGYPSTLMAYMAHLRQFFLDARRHEELLERATAGRPDRRPPFDPDLSAVTKLLAGEERLLCFADGARDIVRWLRLADEFGFQVAFAGGGQAWRVADLLAERGCPLVLTLDWGDEVDDPDAEEDAGGGKEEGEEATAVETAAEAGAEPWKYTEPIDLRRERRRLWEEGRDAALRLHEAGVPIAFGSGGERSSKLLERVRALVEAGLPADVALAGLTSSAARVLGISDRVGRIAEGQCANIALWSGSPVTGKADLAWLVVDGQVFEFDPDEASEEDGEPDEGVDATGAWELSFESDEAPDATMSLEMAPTGSVSGSFVTTSPINGEKVAGDLTGQVWGKTVRLQGKISFGAFEAALRFEGTLEGDTIRGESGWRFSGGEETSEFTARRTPPKGEEVRR